MTALEDTEAWISSNQSWLTDDHKPMVGQLRMIAESMDSERAAKGLVSGALANAYRMAYRTLMEVKHLGDRQDPAIPGGLFGPTSGAGGAAF